MRTKLIAYFCLFFLISFFSCKKIKIYPDEPQKKLENLAPTEFKVVYSNLTGVSASLKWDVSYDPEYTAVTYKIELNGAVIISGLTNTTYQLGQLNPETKYIGKVIATDADGNERSATFEFTTRDGAMKFIYDYNPYKTSNLSSQNCIKLNDGSVVITGWITDFLNGALRYGYVYRINKAGEQLWYKYLDISPYRGTMFLTQTTIAIPSSNEFIFAYGNKVIRMNANGEVLWEKTPTGSTNEQFFTAGIITHNKELIFTTDQKRIIKMSLDGQLIWIKNDVTSRIIKDFVEDSKGNLFVIGNTIGEKEHWLAKLTSDATIIWEKTFFKRIANQQELYYSSEKILIDQSDNLYFFGFVYDFYYLRFFKIDSNGNILINNTVNEDIRPTSAYLGKDNSIVMAGIGHFGWPDYYPIVKRYDLDFKEKLSLPLRQLTPSFLWDIIETDDGMFAISYNLGIKMNANGDYE